MPDIIPGTTNEVLEVKLDYILKDIQDIKSDIKDIKNENITRREFNEAMVAMRKEFDNKLQSLKDEIAPLKKFVYSLIAIFGIAIVGALLKLVIKQ